MATRARRRRPRRNRNRNGNRNGNGNNNSNGRGNGRKGRGTTTAMVAYTNGNGLSNRGNLSRPIVQKRFTEVGSDFLATVTVKPTPALASERILCSLPISPTAFPGTRLFQLSNLWERYRFRKFKLRWVPAVPKTLACQFVVYQDTDPLDDPTSISNVAALIRQATAQAGSRQFNFINATQMELAQRGDDQLYYTGLDHQNERFSRQGNFYVIQVTDPINFNGEPLTSDIIAGSLYVDWVCDFQVAQINPGFSETNLFTTQIDLPITSGNVTRTFTGPAANVVVSKISSVSPFTGPMLSNLDGLPLCDLQATATGCDSWTATSRPILEGQVITFGARAGIPTDYSLVFNTTVAGAITLT